MKMHTAEYRRRRISHWEWLKRQYPDCETIPQVAQYIIRKYSK
jgi:hypothetical protein